MGDNNGKVLIGLLGSIAIIGLRFCSKTFDDGAKIISKSSHHIASELPSASARALPKTARVIEREYKLENGNSSYNQSNSEVSKDSLELFALKKLSSAFNLLIKGPRERPIDISINVEEYFYFILLNQHEKSETNGLTLYETIMTKDKPYKLDKKISQGWSYFQRLFLCWMYLNVPNYKNLAKTFQDNMLKNTSQEIVTGLSGNNSRFYIEKIKTDQKLLKYCYLGFYPFHRQLTDTLAARIQK